MYSSRRRSFIVWLASFAVLTGLLAPSFFHGLKAQGRAGWVEVCSALGSRLVRLEASPNGTAAGPKAPAEPLDHAVPHCPCCLSHLVTLDLPPSAGMDALSAPSAFLMPESFWAALGSHFAWRAAQPRAPPVAG